MKHLVLLGAGHAHVHVLKGLAENRPADLRITVVAPQPQQLYSGMVPGFVAGFYTLDQCEIALQPLMARCAAQYVGASGAAINADAKTLTLSGGLSGGLSGKSSGGLSDGQTMAYDFLSLNTGSVMDRKTIDAAMPGAREHALFVRPIEAFGKLWPQVVGLAAERPVHLVVVGAGAAGLELAMAAAHALDPSGNLFSKTSSDSFPGSSRNMFGDPLRDTSGVLPGSRITLVTGGAKPAQNYPDGVQRRVGNALKRLQITVLQDSCVGLSPGVMRLASGMTLACDVPLLAIGAQAPAWLAGSGLSLDHQGFVAVNSFQQSTSHANVFAAGDVASRVDTQHSRSGVYAVHAGPPLLANLRSALAAQPLTAYQPPGRTLNLLSCGTRYAIASWGRYSVEGAWVWRWKDAIDRQFVKRYSTAS